MTDKLRIFIGVPLPQSARRELAALQQTLSADRRSTPRGLRFVASEQLHLTLKFVGWLPDERVEPFRELVRKAAADTEVVETRLARVTGYPAARRARVLVAELSDPDAGLAALATRIDRAAETLGVAPERRAFRPHVTLARASPPANVTPYQGVPLSDATFRLNELVLFRSQLLPTGSVYARLCSGTFAPPTNSSLP